MDELYVCVHSILRVQQTFKDMYDMPVCHALLPKLHADSVCQDHLVMATVNGAPSAVKTDTYDRDMVVLVGLADHVRPDQAATHTVESAMVCLVFRAPCTSLARVLGNDQQVTLYYVTEGVHHRCCPVCGA